MVHHPIVDEFQSLIEAIELDNTQSIKIEYGARSSSAVHSSSECASA